MEVSESVSIGKYVASCICVVISGSCGETQCPYPSVPFTETYSWYVPGSGRAAHPRRWPSVSFSYYQHHPFVACMCVCVCCAVWRQRWPARWCQSTTRWRICHLPMRLWLRWPWRQHPPPLDQVRHTHNRTTTCTCINVPCNCILFTCT